VSKYNMTTCNKIFHKRSDGYLTYVSDGIPKSVSQEQRQASKHALYVEGALFQQDQLVFSRGDGES
ncbi:hypothetical protein ACJX0J_031657, partial [Zea mays]